MSGKHLRIYEQEGVLEARFTSSVSDVYLNTGGWSYVRASAVLAGPGSQFVGKRVRITITALEEIPSCARCGLPACEAHVESECKGQATAPAKEPAT